MFRAINVGIQTNQTTCFTKISLPQSTTSVESFINKKSKKKNCSLLGIPDVFNCGSNNWAKNITLLCVYISITFTAFYFCNGGL